LTCEEGNLSLAESPLSIDFEIITSHELLLFHVTMLFMDKINVNRELLTIIIFNKFTGQKHVKCMEFANGSLASEKRKY
jgi:hypothetical protein